MTVATLEGVRLSELARCPRMCAMRACGCEPQEVASEWQRYFSRGLLFEHYVAEQYAALDGRDNIIRQLVIRWPLGEGHADLYRKERRELIEVKSTTVPDGVIFDTAVRQVRLYKHFYTPAKRAGVYLVNPSNLRREDFITVKLGPSDVDEIETLVAQVKQAIDTNGEELPACSMGNPGQCRNIGCPFTAQAWEGWQPETVTIDAEEAAALAQSLYELKRDARKHKAEAEELEKGYKQVQSRLAEIGVEPGTDYTFGPFKLRRIVTAESESFSLSKAVKTGNFNEHDRERFREFIGTRNGSERWTVDLVGANGGEPSAEDFGMEAPY